ncbi:MAG: hypothetical protein K2Y01_04145 [Rhabdochlamydiaceae bacterium]|nr:hypothetical protein [Rhabdochlamydiaceae bacterium]
MAVSRARSGVKNLKALVQRKDFHNLSEYGNVNVMAQKLLPFGRWASRWILCFVVW